MEEGSHHYRLGLFVVVSVTILAVVLFALGGRKLFRETYTFETYFDDSVSGLEIGAPVRYRGVPLGEVSEILTSAAAYERKVPLNKRHNYIVVRAKVAASAVQTHQLRHDEPEMVKLGMRAQTQLAGITGQQYLSLDFFEPAKYPQLPFDWTPDNIYVPSAPSLSGEIIASAQQFLASLNKADVRTLGQNLNKLVVILNDRVAELPTEQLSADAHDLFKNTNMAVTRINQLFSEPGLKQSIDNVAGLTARLRQIADSGDLDRTVKHIDETIERLNGLVGDNQYDLRVIVEDLRQTADNLRTLSASVKRYPAGALIGGPPKEVQFPAQSP
jgi:phospholipid/cholesterol/gamma-HCH transport system substrate-binding protein/paraquat-inducible protein B